MSDVVIAAQELSKRYLIGEAEQRHETLAGTLASALLAPFRNARNLARLDVRAPHRCIAYAARCWNHPAISLRVTSCKAEANAA
jgi:hypothetical protein